MRIDCDKQSFLCQLDRIADDLAGFEWNDFTATLVGALVAAGISFWLYRIDARGRRTSEIDAAVVALIREVQTHGQAYTRFHFHMQTYASQSIPGKGIRPAVPFPASPDRAGLDTAIESLIVLSSGAEREVARPSKRRSFSRSWAGMTRRSLYSSVGSRCAHISTEREPKSERDSRNSASSVRGLTPHVVEIVSPGFPALTAHTLHGR